ncbi:MAG: dimethylarginine dimethylaminohydrolase family protein [Candidatus Odinarchaeota archaeon]
MLENEGSKLTKVVTCSPKREYFHVDDPAAHNIIEVADPEKATEQHLKLRTVLENFGSEVIDADELVRHPNSVFTRDTALVTPRGYVKLSMGIATRDGEEQWMAGILDSLNEPCTGMISKPGTVEGGDVIVCGSVVFMGRTRRTNVEGIEQLSRIFHGMDYEVRVARLPDTYLHLDQVIGVFGPDYLVYCRELFTDKFFEGFDTVKCSCDGFNVNFICLGNSEILAPLANTGIASLAREHGIKVRAVDLSEFAKGAGGPNCLVMPVERE